MSIIEMSAELKAEPAPSPNNTTTIPPLRPTNTLPDEPSENPQQPNLLPKSEYSRGVGLAIDPFTAEPEFGTDGRVSISYNGVEVFHRDLPWPPNFAGGAIQFFLPLTALGDTHGPRLLEYVIEPPSGNGGIADTLTISIDTLAPHNDSQPPQPYFTDPALADGLLTPGYLESNGGVEFTVPAYDDWQPGDSIQVFIDGIVAPVHVQSVPAAGQFTFTVTAASFPALSDAQHKVYYRLYDRAGNDYPGGSHPFYFRWLQGELPENLQAPRMPEAPIDLAEARSNVPLVEIDEYDGAEVDDTVRLYLVENGARKLLSLTRLTLGFTWPLEMYFRYPEWMALPVANGSVELLYTVTRSGVDVTSPADTFAYDLRVVGPEPDPNNPDPVSPLLIAPVIRPAVSGTDDVLTPDDADQNSTVVIQPYENAKPGDIVTVFYGSTNGQLAAFPLPEPVGSSIEVPLPWDIVKAIGSGEQIAVWYEISGAPGGDNFHRSPTKYIHATVAAVVTLARPTVPNVAANGYVACCQRPWEGVDIKMLDSANVVEGDTYELDWQLFLLSSEYPMPGLPIEETRHTFSGTFDTATEVANGKTHRVPGSPYIEGTVNGYFAIRWRSYHNGVQTGESPQHLNGYNIHVVATDCICGPGQLCGVQC